MTEICLLGARRIELLSDLHKKFLGIFDARQAVSMRNEMLFAKEYKVKSISWSYVKTNAPLLQFNRAKGLHFSSDTSRFLCREFQYEDLFFAMVSIRNKESEQEAITRFFLQAPYENLIECIDKMPIEADVMYVSGKGNNAEI
jgi:hypothetical protein